MAPNLDEIEDELLRLPNPVTTAAEVADRLDCSRRHALDSLRLLERDGAVASKQVGASAVAWCHQERVTPPPEPDPEPAQAPLEGRQALLDVVDLPGSGDRSEQREDALLEAIDLLEQRGEASASEIREHVYEIEPAGYDSARSMWKNSLQPALRSLDDEGAAVRLVDGHSGVWGPR